MKMLTRLDRVEAPSIYGPHLHWQLFGQVGGQSTDVGGGHTGVSCDVYLLLRDFFFRVATLRPHVEGSRSQHSPIPP